VFKSDVPFYVKSEAFFPPDCGIFSYPFDGAALHDAAAGDDCALLPGLVSDAGDRLAAIPRFHVFQSPSFYLAAQKELRPKTWLTTFLYMPL